MIKAVIFDMDGLMFDTEELTAASWVLAGRQLGLNITRELAISVIGIRECDTGDIFKEALGDELDFKLACRVRMEYFNKYVAEHGVPVKHGLKNLLDRLNRDGYALAVASSTEHSRVHFCLEQTGVIGYFQAVVCGDTVKRGKPEPDAFLEAARALSIPCEECMVLEDSINGVIAASRAHTPVIMVPDLVAPTDETDRIAVATVKTLDDAYEIIKSYGRI